MFSAFFRLVSGRKGRLAMSIVLCPFSRVRTSNCPLRIRVLRACYIVIFYGTITRLVLRVLPLILCLFVVWDGLFLLFLVIATTLFASKGFSLFPNGFFLYVPMRRKVSNSFANEGCARPVRNGVRPRRFFHLSFLHYLIFAIRRRANGVFSKQFPTRDR